MSRLFALLCCALFVLAATGPARAADDDFGGWRGSYMDNWEFTDIGDPLRFEIGLRYWYALGAQQFSISGDDFSSTDGAHILEGHVRIDDFSTNTYVKALAGAAVAINGDYSTPLSTGSIVDGKIGYAGADLGYYPLSFEDSTIRIGAFGGYQYWNDSPDTARENFFLVESVDDVAWSTSTGLWTIGGDSAPNNIDINLLRLGITGRAEFAERFDINAELAVVPYARVTGTFGAHGVLDYSQPDYTIVKTSPTTIDGWGYGAMAEVMLGWRPRDNVTVRLGGRAWYLTGTVDATWTEATIIHPVDVNPADGTYEEPVVSTQGYISTSNPFSLFRLGGLIEVTTQF